MEHLADFFDFAKQKLNDEQLLLDTSFLSNTYLQNYMKLVYNVEEINTDKKVLLARLTNELVVEKIKASLMTRNDQHPIYLHNDMPIGIKMKNIIIDKDGSVHIVKHASKYVQRHIEAHDHPYWIELSIQTYLISRRIPIVGQKHFLHIITPEKEILTFEKKLGELPSTNPELEIKKLWELIKTGQEPDVCEDTWDGSRCRNYCQYASHRLNLCKYDKEK